jgi:hypothetical protein
MSPAPGRTEESPEQKGFKGSGLCDVGNVIIPLQRIAMTLTRMHATGTCLAATMSSYTAPNQVSQTTTNLPYGGGQIGRLRDAAQPFLS